MSSWTEIAALFDPVEGAIIATSLRAGGVRVVEPDIHIHSVRPDMRLAFGGYRIWVHTNDLEQAREIAGTWHRSSPEPV